jgi:hypothetical protein
LLVSLAVWLLAPVRVRGSDLQSAFGTLGSCSVAGLRAGQSVSCVVVVPDTGRWARVRSAWGDPGYVVLAVKAGSADVQCLSLAHLRVEVTVDGHPVELAKVSEPVYGYSAHCAPLGVKFFASPGSKVVLHIESEEGNGDTGLEVIVLHDWGFDIKDRIVGVDLDERLRGVGAVCALAGGAALALSVVAVSRRRKS